MYTPNSTIDLNTTGCNDQREEQSYGFSATFLLTLFQGYSSSKSKTMFFKTPYWANLFNDDLWMYKKSEDNWSEFIRGGVWGLCFCLYSCSHCVRNDTLVSQPHCHQLYLQAIFCKSSRFIDSMKIRRFSWEKASLLIILI